jgi:hypothetical protein
MAGTASVVEMVGSWEVEGARRWWPAWGSGSCKALNLNRTVASLCTCKWTPHLPVGGDGEWERDGVPHASWIQEKKVWCVGQVSIVILWILVGTGCEWHCTRHVAIVTIIYTEIFYQYTVWKGLIDAPTLWVSSCWHSALIFHFAITTAM